MTTTDILERLVNLLLVDAKFTQDGDCLPLPLASDSNQQMLNTDEFILESVSLASSAFQEACNSRRSINLLSFISHLRSTVKAGFNSRFHRHHIHTQFLQYVRGQTACLLKQSHQDMLHIPLTVAKTADKLLRNSQHFPCLLSKPLWPHRPPLSIWRQTLPV